MFLTIFPIFETGRIGTLSDSSKKSQSATMGHGCNSSTGRLSEIAEAQGGNGGGATQ